MTTDRGLAAFRTALYMRIHEELVCGCVSESDNPADWHQGLCQGAALAAMLVKPEVGAAWHPTADRWTPTVRRYYEMLRHESYGELSA